eukprot:755413-Hanusia_phi.AAC.3
MESKLGVSDNMLPGGKRSVDKGQFALSSYDQEILAKGPPQEDSGPPPAPAEQSTVSSSPPSYSPMGSYGQGAYQSSYTAYPNAYGSAGVPSTQSPGYAYYQPQQYSPYQASYAPAQVYQQPYSQVCLCCCCLCDIGIDWGVFSCSILNSLHTRQAAPTTTTHKSMGNSVGPTA